MAKKTTSGNCFICGNTASKIVTRNHLLKSHNSGDEPCYLIKAEGAYDKNYWLFFSVPLSATLASIDDFLREIWCECCGHLSGFRMGSKRYGNSRKISFIDVGDKLLYEYDFGSTTEIIVTVVSEILRPKQGEEVILLARNEPMHFSCATCKAPAVHVNVWENKLFCEPCTPDLDDGGFLPITNSPRMGECGYCGESDIWIFDPKITSATN
ncbi:MAG: plasmid pRiA4b ORF-3 family protein [Defluviitaleaceae bacterium]|nr:plasmid pRiA4b ORF-3 family protein [Defluviitaleaceae bacterium]